jgi:hypothetical protein
MITVDYTYYKDTYGGSLSEEDFKRLVNIAYVVVDNFTFGRFQMLDEKAVNDFTLMKVKTCICALCDKVENATLSGVAIKSSEKVGSWSVNYAADSLPKSVQASLYSVVNFYLGGTALTCSWI